MNLKCARCGAEPKLNKIITGRTDSKGRLVSYWEVACPECSTKTIRHYYRKDAIIDWNRLQRRIDREENGNDQAESNVAD